MKENKHLPYITLKINLKLTRDLSIKSEARIYLEEKRRNYIYDLE